MNTYGLVENVLHYWSESGNEAMLSRSRQFLEMVALYFLRRIGPGYYLQARWGRASIPFARKWQHLNRSEYRELAARLNPPAYQKASQHKLVEKSVLTMLALPTPRFIAFVHPERGRDANGKPVRSAQQLEALLRPFVNERVCFKLVEGWGGMGFASYQIVAGENGNIRLMGRANTAPLQVSQWWQSMPASSDGYLIETYLEQHPDLAAMNPSSVNTVRMWIAQDGNRWEVLGAYLRIGQRGSEVDNATSGGITCRLDPGTGELLEAYDPARPGKCMTSHPDSGAPLVGSKIPWWVQARQLAADAISSFPHMRMAGLDIAFGVDGPSLIELNLVPDYIGCARMDLPLKPLLRKARLLSK